MFSIQSTKQPINVESYAQSYTNAEQIRAQERASIRAAQTSLAIAAMNAASRGGGGGGVSQPKLSRQERMMMDKQNKMKNNINQLALQNKQLEFTYANNKLEQNINIQGQVAQGIKNSSPLRQSTANFNAQMQAHTMSFTPKTNMQRR